jgi:hypothetical protein
MPSEYDFLLPYSRAARRIGIVLLGAGAFLAGAVSMAAIIALPLRPVGNTDKGASTAAVKTEKPMVATKPAPPAASESSSASQAPAATPDRLAGRPPDAAPAEAAKPQRDATDAANNRRNETTGAADARDERSHASPSAPAPAQPAARSFSETAQVPTRGAEGATLSGAVADAPRAAARKPSHAEGPAAAEPKARRKPAERSARAAEAPAVKPESPAENVEAKPQNSEPTVSTRREKSGRQARSARGNRASASRQEQRRLQADRAPPRRDEQGRRDERLPGREFVDANGVRHIILPRRWRGAGYDDSAFAYDRPRSRAPSGRSRFFEDEDW